MPELAVDSIRLPRGQLQLFHYFSCLLLDQHEPGRISVLHNQHAIFPDGLGGVDLSVRSLLVIPNDFLVGCDLARPLALAVKDDVAAAALRPTIQLPYVRNRMRT